jgi:hypothetical protein
LARSDFQKKLAPKSMDPAFLIVMVVLLFMWTRENFPGFFPKKTESAPTKEGDLAKALEKYLLDGIKVKSN